MEVNGQRGDVIEPQSRPNFHAIVSGGGGAEHLEGSQQARETQVLYGVKLRLSEQRAWWPESSLIVQGHAPMSGPDPATAFTLGYVVGWELPEDWKLDSAIRFGADKEQDDRFETWSPSIVLRKTLAERYFQVLESHEFLLLTVRTLLFGDLSRLGGE